MRQTGAIGTGLLLLPSGDWKAIAPFHTHAAIFRAIENGCSILRQASGGLSVAADYRGKILQSLDFFDPGEKFWITDVPVQHIDTVYQHIGDSFAYLCGFVFAGSLLLVSMRKIRKKD